MSLLPAEEREQLLDELSEEEAEALWHDWEFWARPNQLPPAGDWRTWLLLAGRGFGKTRCGAEWVREQMESGMCSRVALVAPTAADVRDVMVEGESGILAVCPPSSKPLYEPSKRRLTWPNGALATTYSADEPDRLRGPQHDGAWADELAAWKYPEAWDQLMFGLRLGADPRAVVTTTPRPVGVIRDLLKSDTTETTRGSTYENEENLAAVFLEKVVAKYEGTRLGRQELAGELLDDIPGSLWTRQMIDEAHNDSAPNMKRVVVAIDPAVTSGEDSDMTGIVVAGVGVDGRGYVLADRTCRLSPDGWAKRAVEAYEEFNADRIVAEVNNGGDMVEGVIRSAAPRIPYKKVHASRGKRVRAEPIAALYEQGKVGHVGELQELEDQMCSFVPEGYDGSPDRVDSLVWAMTELMLDASPEPRIRRLAL